MPPVPAVPVSATVPEKARAVSPDDRTSTEKQIIRAESLEAQRAELMKLIGSNREYLRLMAANDELSDEQMDWLDDFYPQKEKGERRSEDEVERTRLAKAAARQRN